MCRAITLRVLVGDVRTTVELLIAGSIHCVTAAAALRVLMGGGARASLALSVEVVLVATTIRRCG